MAGGVFIFLLLCVVSSCAGCVQGEVKVVSCVGVLAVVVIDSKHLGGSQSRIEDTSLGKTLDTQHGVTQHGVTRSVVNRTLASRDSYTTSTPSQPP